MNTTKQIQGKIVITIYTFKKSFTIFGPVTKENIVRGLGNITIIIISYKL